MPFSDGFPKMQQGLDACGFPSANLSDAHLEEALRPSRIEAIREALQRSGEGFRYLVPWMDKVSLMAGWADHVFSHSVLQHVADPAATWQAMAILGKPGAALTHQTQFGSHNITDAWNGHWAVPAWMWRVAEGNKPFLIKRAPCSHQLANIDRVGLEVVMCLRDPATSAATCRQLAARFRDLSDGDPETLGAFFVARKAHTQADLVECLAAR